VNLPENFLDIMKDILQDEYDDFLKSFKIDNVKGLRINTLKIDTHSFTDKNLFNLENIPWCNEGFYMKDYDEERPAKHPYYHCGLYYIQEPSAMIPVEVLDPQPGDKVLDIAAAPGGKTTQIAAKLQNKGIIVSNYISPKRVRALEKNINLFGIKNSIILNDSPENIKNNFANYFDKILIDAPCSGEGMFKRDKRALSDWNEENNTQLSKLQRDILSNTASMLKPGGRLVYSTCTFSLIENEGTIDWFLKEFPEFEVLDIEGLHSLSPGMPHLIRASEDISKTRRAWPHKIHGDGHFIALLQKKSSVMEDNPQQIFQIKNNFTSDELSIIKQFFVDTLNIEEKNIIRIKNKVYIPTDIDRDISGVRIISNGIYLGELKKNRFIPSQQYAMTLEMKDAKNVVNISSKDINSYKYLKGETIMLENNKGWNLICIDSFPCGWAKGNGDSLKNYYEPSWRMR